MSRKSTLDALFGVKPAGAVGMSQPAPETKALPGSKGPADHDPPRAPAAPVAPPPIRTGAVAAIGASLQHWGEQAKAAEALQRQLASAETVIELDPSLVDPAPVRDRLSGEEGPAFEALVQAIAETGQQVPILVRPHPDSPGRHQAAYGHRRLAACRRLGLPVRAIVVQLTDEALMLAQARENSERLDLSFIERARYAARLEAAGQTRAAIGRALGLDKADLSRVIAVAKVLPDILAEAIGPAPKAGRARWLQLIEALTDQSAAGRALEATVASGFSALDSDTRFARVLAAATAREKPAGSAPSTVIAGDNGAAVVAFAETGKAARLTIDGRLAPGFAAFVASEMPALYARWRAESAGQAGKQTPAPAQPRMRTVDPP
jgi:ParB family chromosome partitioning protein